MAFDEFSKHYLKDLKEKIDQLDRKKVEKIIAIIMNAYKHNKQIFIFGNGGSAATSSHFATDLGKGTVKDFADKNEKRLKVISLTDNLPVITAYGNDLSYEGIFAEQLANLVNEGDVAIGISASGNSENVIRAIKLANRKKAITIGFCGFSGGKLKKETQFVIHVDHNHYGVVEDVHHVLMHLISYYVKKIKN